ncbi:hypothetical protein QBC34DRAFT_406489 [Podospora aff. communis PSN243]|uniref:GIT Spa2 homology (SHD) domain-containing protein n=1 Tax=Podospora aff. communis PSN243 TaxID=3040156 RepID=A0AAV9GQN7_9PEZI|nr:hypothetical protein QBC34DRAFT_406489 [Podospora aff. communis PSN243]
MHLIQLSVKAAITGLLRVGGGILSKRNAPGVSEDLVDESTRLSDHGFHALVPVILKRLDSLQNALSDLSAVAADSRVAVKTEHLIMILGEGILAFDQLATLLANPSSGRSERLVSLAVSCFHISLSHISNILGSGREDEMPSFCNYLNGCLGSGTYKDGKIVKRLKGARLLTGQPAERNLSEIPDISGVVIPLGAKDLKATGSSYEFEQPSDAGSTTQAISCESVFRLPHVTHPVILQLFRYATGASARFANPEAVSTLSKERQRSAIDKIKVLQDHQMKELCVDVYDELVRRNLKDKKAEAGGRLVTTVEPPVVLETFSERRNQARVKLSTLSDTRFMNLLADVRGDLERRCQMAEGNTVASE